MLWAKDASQAQFALRSLDVLKERTKESWDRIVSELSQVELSARPEAVSIYIGHNFDAIEMAGKNRLVAKMDMLINTNGSDKRAIDSYYTLVMSMPGAAWAVTPLKDHLVRLLDRISAMHNTPEYLRQLLPIAASLFKFSVDGKVGQILTALLSNSAGIPAAYVVVHHSLKGAWPAPGGNIGNYAPDNVVNRACQFVRDQQGYAGIGDVYESVCKIAQGGLSNATSNQGIADITPIIWRSAPETVAAVSGFVAKILTPPNVAELLTGAQVQGLERDTLSGFLVAISNAFAKDNRHDAAKRILSSAPVQLLGRPDGAFAYWAFAATKCDPGFVIDILADDGLNDEQRNRVLVLADDLTLTGAPASVEALLKDSTRPKTRSALIGRLAEVTKACPSDGVRSRLAKHMTASLPSLSGEDLHSVARCIGDLGGVSALERDDAIIGTLDGDQIGVLAKAFPTSRRFRKALEN